MAHREQPQSGRIALAPVHRTILQVIANDPRMYATLQATETFPYTLLERVRVHYPQMSEQALRAGIETLESLDVVQKHPQYTGFRVLRTGSEILSGTQ